MAEITDKTSLRVPLFKAWQVFVAALIVTTGMATAYLTKENERNIRDLEFRHLILDQMKGFMTYTAMNAWVDDLERKNPSLVLPRVRQAAVEEPTKNSFQAAVKGNSYVR